MARLALAAVVGLSLAHSSLSYQAHRPLATSGAASARGHAVCATAPVQQWQVFLRRPALRRTGDPSGQLQMAVAGSEAVGEVEGEEVQALMAAELAEEAARETVRKVVEAMMQQSSVSMAPAPHGSLPPRLWLDNVDALLNEPVYKNVMYQRLESCSSEEELVLLEVPRGIITLYFCSMLSPRSLPVYCSPVWVQVVDEKLLQFKKDQRDTRNKAKLEFIIGASLEGPQVLSVAHAHEHARMHICIQHPSIRTIFTYSRSVHAAPTRLQMEQCLEGLDQTMLRACGLVAHTITLLLSNNGWCA